MRHTRVLLAFFPLISCTGELFPTAGTQAPDLAAEAKKLVVVPGTVSFQSSPVGILAWIRVSAQVRNNSSIPMNNVRVSVLVGTQLDGATEWSSIRREDSDEYEWLPTPEGLFLPFSPLEPQNLSPGESGTTSHKVNLDFKARQSANVYSIRLMAGAGSGQTTSGAIDLDD